MYVALSRIRHSKNMFFIGHYNCAARKFNALVEKVYLRLRKESQIETLTATQINEENWNVTFLNTQSLRKY